MNIMSMDILTTNENAVYSFFPCSCICNMETQLSEWTGSHILVNKMVNKQNSVIDSDSDGINLSTTMSYGIYLEFHSE